jgi:hypothetical protein
LLPEGQELDLALIGALQESFPEGAKFGFNWRKDDGRPWGRVTQPGNPRDALTPPSSAWAARPCPEPVPLLRWGND